MSGEGQPRRGPYDWREAAKAARQEAKRAKADAIKHRMRADDALAALEQTHGFLSAKYATPGDYIAGMEMARQVTEAALARVKGGER